MVKVGGRGKGVWVKRGRAEWADGEEDVREKEPGIRVGERRVTIYCKYFLST